MKDHSGPVDKLEPNWHRPALTSLVQHRTSQQGRQARPDFTELDVFLGHHILLTLE